MKDDEDYLSWSDLRLRNIALREELSLLKDENKELRNRLAAVENALDYFARPRQIKKEDSEEVLKEIKDALARLRYAKDTPPSTGRPPRENDDVVRGE